jgi:hypothetical protein
MASGGRRKGAGRPAGSGWRPAVSEMRTAAAEQLVAVVGSERDPLSIVLSFACNESLDVQTRLGACSIALPFLYPRLSATQVDARHTVQKIDSADLLQRLDERLAKLAAPVTIEASATEPETLFDGVLVGDADDEPE